MRSLRFLLAISLLAPAAAAQADKLYWSDTTDGTIERCDPDGMNHEVVLTGLDEPRQVIVNTCDGKLYWTEYGARTISRSNMDGSNIELLYTSATAHRPSGLALDMANRRMFFTESVQANGNSRISRATLDGGNPQVLTGLGNVDAIGIDIDLDANRMYWAEATARRICRANLNGGQVTVVVPLPGPPIGFTLDLTENKLVWANEGTPGPSVVQRSNLNGSNIETLVNPTNNPAVAIDPIAGKVYYSDQPGGSSSILRANLDGTGVETLVTGLTEPTLFNLQMADAGVQYCTPIPNSTGSPAELCTWGTASINANEFTLVAQPVPNQPGIFFYGPMQTQTAFGNGNLCITGQISRLDPTTASNGVLSWLLDNTAPPSASGQITASSTWNFQAWYRDPAAGGANFNLSDGRSVTFIP